VRLPLIRHERARALTDLPETVWKPPSEREVAELVSPTTLGSNRGT
jgi:hypothetical protein